MSNYAYMMAPGARLDVENGHLVESMGQYLSGPRSGPPGPLAPLHGDACCSSCASGGPCSSSSMGDFTGGVGNLLVLGLAIYGGYTLFKKYAK
jgi:hypothetical protein